MIKVFLGFCVLLVITAQSAGATTRRCNGTVADFARQVAASSDGDVILFTADGTWASGAVVSGRGITIDLGGFTIARGATSETLMAITTDPDAPTRLTHGTFANSADGRGGDCRAVGIDGEFSNPKFRIDHVTFTSTADHTIHLDVCQAWGLIDHCRFSGNDASEMIHNMSTADNTAGNPGWNQVIVPGGADAVYVEDCIFSKADQTDRFCWGTSAIQSYYGARTVVRYCTMNYCQIDQHGTRGAVGARWGEYYHNDFHLPDNPGGQNQGVYIDFRGGSGVIFNNRYSGGPDGGGRDVNIHEEDSGGYPEIWQPGRGRNTTFPPTSGSQQELAPIYCWSNAGITINGQATYVEEGRDFYANTPRPGFKPYIYPYPWTARTTGRMPTDDMAVSPGNSVSGPKGTR